MQFIKKSALNRVFLAILATLLFSGCQTNSTKIALVAKQPSSVSNDWLKVSYAKLMPGNEVQLGSEGAQIKSAKIKTVYDSALGQRCMQVKILLSKELLLLCHQQADYWKPQPILSQPNITQ
ncbi:MAG: hypothetical protein U9N57_11905 [Pseudomonadota bacterium]|nr:hypothetical protein [Pseudomonadota bacterium]